ncbi:MAG: M64 family metallo-endopeptidase [Ignavibacteriales bacterium]|nr:M64 family metallo-endopeptidase [Ignavibacteriales bacterium]
MKVICLIITISTSLFAQVNFEKYFESKTLRIDYYHTGTKDSELYSIDELRGEQFWGGSKVNLIDKFEFGKYKVMVLDSTSNDLIYSHCYSTLFSEWQTTEEAKHTTKSFSETVVIPYPKSNVKVEFYSREGKNIFQKKFEYFINPKNYFINPESRMKFDKFEIVHSGDPDKKVDIVIIPDGYTKEQLPKFKADCTRFAIYLFNASPYKENKDKFNLWGIEAASEDSGTDIPKNNIWKRTILNTTFYSFDLDRYCMTSDNKSVRDVAANAPYDQIYILVNTNKYGGGSIYNHYSVCVSDSKYSEYIFTHEFGHGFVGLADEYYTSDVAYENFYPLDIEPWEANITTRVNFKLKWANMIETDTPIPTPNEEKYKDVVGLFEGGGYVAKGVFRPKFDCTMKSISINNFCPVCKKAILEMIDFYSE